MVDGVVAELVPAGRHGPPVGDMILHVFQGEEEGAAKAAGGEGGACLGDVAFKAVVIGQAHRRAGAAGPEGRVRRTDRR